MSSRVCVCCVYDLNVNVGVPSIYLVCVCMSEVISTFSAVSEGSQLFDFLMSFLYCIFLVMCSGKSLHYCDDPTTSFCCRFILTIPRIVVFLEDSMSFVS